MLPQRALTDRDILKFAKQLKIKNFRGVFMRNEMPKKGSWKKESGVVNLDDKKNPGTHWVAYKKLNKNLAMYFDSFGNLQPPNELVKYLDVGNINYNYERYQDWNTFNCGHLCLKFLAGKV